ncbi:MAG: glycosyltransferase family 4 protein [Acidobacteria bacterium]|nr:glycosyltransferase family 4 protein [Acidobacteriota bacterium]
MNIGIDARPAERPASRHRGVGMYTRRLCEALLAKNRTLGMPHRFVLAGSSGAQMGADGVSVRPLPSIRKPSRLQWVLDRWALPRFLRDERLDIFHAMEFTSIPSSSRSRIIAHVHDMIPFVFWEEYSRRIPADYRLALRLARRRVHHADRIITGSEHSKKDIARMTGYPESRIRVVYFGPGGIVDSAGHAPGVKEAEPPSPAARSTLGGRPYFIYVGGTDFRKNVAFLVRSFGLLAARFPEVRLILVGETFLTRGLPEVEDIYREIEHYRLSERLFLPGFVDAGRLRHLYANAAALVFPSLYEGFGLPVLEAMTLRVPVIAGRASSIPEVLGDAGVYFDPRQEDSLVAAMEAILVNPSLRQDLIARAESRAKQFSWQSAAEAVFRIYEELR